MNGLEKLKSRQAPSIFPDASLPFNLFHKHNHAPDLIHASPAAVLLGPAADLKSAQEMVTSSFGGDVKRSYYSRPIQRKLLDEGDIRYEDARRAFDEGITSLSAQAAEHTRLAVSFFSAEGHENVPALALIAFHSGHELAKSDAMGAIDEMFATLWYRMACAHVLDEKTKTVRVEAGTSNTLAMELIELVHFIRPLALEFVRGHDALIVARARSLLESLDGLKFKDPDGRVLLALEFLVSDKSDSLQFRQPYAQS